MKKILIIILFLMSFASFGATVCWTVFDGPTYCYVTFSTKKQNCSQLYRDGVKIWEKCTDKPIRA